MPTLLLELFSEEIPSRMQRSGAEQLQRLVTEGFKKSGLEHAAPKAFVSPRHLAIQIAALPTIQPDTREERRGPKVGAPEQAMKGFLSSTGLTLEQCEQRDGYYYATIERKGRAVAEVAKEICEGALNAFTWPKSMKWGARSMQWVRPLHKIVCLLDDAIVPVQFGHLSAGNITHGHRFLSPGEIKITHAEKYEALLADAKVMVDFAKRREAIAGGIANVAAEAKLALHEDDDLLNEVTGLVEHPVPLLCEFDAKFLDLPPEVLISEMKNHQRYFALYGADGKLTNRFITVANMVNADGGARVKDGNARVVRARLADGEFYWEQDRKVKLEDWAKKLSDVVFHAKVGMMNEKVARIEKLAVEIAKAVGFSKDIALVKRAAQLCKADLTSGMVGEFPELQGIMGRYYAKAQNEQTAISEAIYEHYKPQGASDTLPETEIGAIISVADKLDSIISLFAAGEKPTGSKDPLALRRAALGIIRIVRAREWYLDLGALSVTDEVFAFLLDRLKVLMRDEGVAHDIIDATLSREVNDHQKKDIMTHYNFIRGFVSWSTSGDAYKKQLTSLKRVYNILAAEEKKAGNPFVPNETINSLELAAESALIKEVNLRATIGPIHNFASLADAIDRFFEDVLITESGKREARLALLSGVRSAANKVADFSKLEG